MDHSWGRSSNAALEPRYLGSPPQGEVVTGLALELAVAEEMKVVALQHPRGQSTPRPREGDLAESPVACWGRRRRYDCGTIEFAGCGG